MFANARWKIWRRIVMDWRIAIVVEETVILNLENSKETKDKTRSGVPIFNSRTTAYFPVTGTGIL